MELDTELGTEVSAVVPCNSATQSPNPPISASAAPSVPHGGRDRAGEVVGGGVLDTAVDIGGASTAELAGGGQEGEEEGGRE